MQSIWQDVSYALRGTLSLLPDGRLRVGDDSVYNDVRPRSITQQYFVREVPAQALTAAARNCATRTVHGAAFAAAEAGNRRFTVDFGRFRRLAGLPRKDTRESAVNYGTIARRASAGR
jgi:hypothetical protein